MKYKEIELEKIFIRNNHRLIEEKDKLESLKKSIEENGLLQPITVTGANQDGMHQLVFGHRRFKAAHLAGMKTIPAMVRNMTMNEIYSAQIVENLQREDVTPIDQQQSFEELLANKYTIEQIADKVGVSKKYVRDRLNLSKLTDEVRDMLLKGTATISHALQFIKLTEEGQKQLYFLVTKKDEQGNVILEPVKELKRAITNRLQIKLANAPFNLDNPDLNPPAGSCKYCPKRSGANKTLFPDVEDEDICFDAVCYRKKLDHYLDDLKKDYEKQGYEVVFVTDRQIEEESQMVNAIDLSFMPESALDQFTVKKLAIYYEAFEAEKIGSVLAVFTDEQLREREKEMNYISDETVNGMTGPEAKEMEEAAEAKNKAVNEFRRDLVNQIAYNISTQDDPIIPDGLLKYMAYLLYNQLDDKGFTIFIKHYQWVAEVYNEAEEKIETITADNANWLNVGYLFEQNINRYSGRDLKEMVVYLILLGLQNKFSTTKTTFDHLCVINAAKQLGIDPEEIQADIENKHETDLSDVINFVKDFDN